MDKALETDSPDKMTISVGPEAGVAPPTAISTAACKVNEHCVGDHWTVGDVELLARLLAIIAMGQNRFTPVGTLFQEREGSKVAFKLALNFPIGVTELVFFPPKGSNPEDDSMID